MENHHSSALSDEEPPAKTRRTSRACLQCRARKQRCVPSPGAVSLQTPCQRCRKYSLTCSFLADDIRFTQESPGPSRMAQLVVELHQQLRQHETRILELEKQASVTTPQVEIAQSSCTEFSAKEIQISQQEEDRLQASSPGHVSSHSPKFSIDGINLGPPIATFRSLGALEDDESSCNHQQPVPKVCHTSRRGTYDPVSRGVLSLSDAQKAIEIYFKHCHPFAAVLNANLRYTWQDLRHSSPVLFLAICSVGTRFWDTKNIQSGVHDSRYARFSELTALLDQAVSKLLLRPTPADVSLDSIRVLLLYAQWMPCNWSKNDDQSSNSSTTTEPAKSRYNEISAWAVLGLALRYALFLGLDRAAIAPFQGPIETVTEEDICRLRVWYNLLTCDFNLMLTSGLPATVDPTLSAQIIGQFTSSTHSQQPGDLRVSALVELVSIVHRAMQSCGDVSGRQLNSYTLRQLNNELEKWEWSWFARLRNTDSQHNQIPFNSVRWYRLALNSASLGPLLSPISLSSRPPLRISLLQSLEISLTAAAQTLLSLSSDGEKYVWKLESQNRSSFPSGLFQVDIVAVRRLYYAVDPIWISHTFAVIFLVLCYIRGAVDENLQIRSLSPDTTANLTLQPAHHSSIVARLLRLALDIFDSVCPTMAFHPACDFRVTVQGATNLVFNPENASDHGNQEMDEMALKSLLDLMNDAGLEWPGNLLDMNGELDAGWEPSGVSDT